MLLYWCFDSVLLFCGMVFVLIWWCVRVEHNFVFFFSFFWGMRELQVLINYNNYGARSDGIFVRFFSDINFFHHYSAMLLLFFGYFFVFFDLRWCCCYFLVVSVILQWRVWSWLRMNASYRLNTCKSRGSMLVACNRWWRPAHGWVTRIQPTYYHGITRRKSD